MVDGPRIAATGCVRLRLLAQLADQHYQTSRHPHQIVDGIISPAHGATYAAGTYWAIVLLNSFAKANNPTEFAAFLNGGGV